MRSGQTEVHNTQKKETYCPYSFKNLTFASSIAGGTGI